MRKEDESKLRATEIRILCMMFVRTFRDGMNNQTIHDMTVMEKIEDS